MTAAAPSPRSRHVTVVISPDEQHAQVTVEGQSYSVTGRTAKETRRAALDLAADYAARTGDSVIVDAQDAESSWRLVATPEGIVRAVAAPEAPRPRNRRRGRVIAVTTVVGALAAVLAGVSFLAVDYLRDTPGEDAPPAADSVVLESRQPPVGFTDQAAWRLPMAPDTQPAVAPDGTLTALVTPEERLAVVGPDGTEEWSTELPLSPDEFTTRQRFVGEGDNLRIALVGDETLWLWPASGGASERVQLPERAEVSFAGTAPLVLADGDAHVVVDGRLERVSTPSGTGALLADGDSVLAASRGVPWTWVRAGEDPEEVDPEEPAEADRLDELRTASARHVLTRWDTAGEDAVLAVHDAGDGSVVAATTVTEELEDAFWAESDGVGAYGPVLVDFDSGSARVVDGFAPASAAGDVVYGELDGSLVAVDGDGDPTEVAEDTARPWGLLDGHAVVVADDDLYALIPQ